MMERLGLLCLLLLAPLVAPAPPADVAGKWRVTISTSDGAMTGKAAFTQRGDRVAGWLGPSENDPIPIIGTVTGNKLIVETFPQSGRNAAFDKCEVTIDGDKMAGTMDTNKAKIEFVRTGR